MLEQDMKIQFLFCGCGGMHLQYLDTMHKRGRFNLCIRHNMMNRLCVKRADYADFNQQ